ncbi:MAG: YebC/PmpR family DNA-binding transcriptional regulator [Bacteroidetes bacterium]|nr:YebC/PmpR family DNA-binding transcriptional regulator [Bacteroidota bacterium]
MGRAFEYRRAAKEKRWGKMSRVFPKLAKAITFAAKTGGANPDLNPLLRMAIQNAKSENMPKDNIDAAIKRAAGRDLKDLEEVVYEGYGPHGIAVIVECTTDNIMRTVANLRSYLTRSGGSLGKTGSVDYLFTRRGVFNIDATGQDLETLELELIDYGLEEMILEEDGECVLLTPYERFGDMQKELEVRGIPVTTATLQRFPNAYTAVTAEQSADLQKLLDKLDDDDDVQAVYHSAGE